MAGGIGKMKVLSVIIPSYNSSEYIDKNIKTFIDQRLYNQVEILIINDGSKDNTAQKAKEYADQYPQLIRVINKENGNHGSVINVGVREAKGKYVKVVDADDWVDTENLVRLVMTLKNMDIDLVINPFIKVDEKTGRKQLCECKIENKDCTVSFEDIIGNDFWMALHSVTYRTSIFTDNNILLTEKCFYEDFQYIFFPMPYVSTVRILDYPIYYYLVGQKTQSVNAENSLKNIDMYLSVYKDSIKYYNSIKDKCLSKRENYMRNRLCVFGKSLYHVYLRNRKYSGIIQKFIDTDKKVKDISFEFYKEIGKSKYIKLMRTGNRLIFSLLGSMFEIYTSKELL